MNNVDVLLFGLTRAQRMDEEDANAARMYGVPRFLCVPRVVPPSGATVARLGATDPESPDRIRRSEARNRQLTA